MSSQVPPDDGRIDLGFSKPFIACLAIGTSLEIAGILLWQNDNKWWLAATVLVGAGCAVEALGFIIKIRENKKL
ncbi:MAG: hypothetical protein PHU53_01695 [Thermoplasmata archaeon]|nr:hypothetical protein [Thermoplasmata archaeon]